MACKLQLDQSDDLLYVKKGNIYCGYRREYLAQNLTKMEEGFVACKKCSGIMREASISNGKTSCLVCSATPKRPNPVIDVQESIKILEIKCPLLRECDWKGELSEAETHLKDCSFFIIQCEECEQLFPRREREEHKKQSCPKRIIRCDYCVMGGRVEDKDKHLQFCYDYPISCPNECGAGFPREELSEHRFECELEVVTCPYKEYGCEAESMLRRDLLAHKKENIVEHQDMSLVEIKQLKVENSRLKKEQNELKLKGMSMKQLDGVEWEIKNLEKLKVGEVLEGPIFYVNNYKIRLFCIREGFLSTPFFYLRRVAGEFDRNLGLDYITHYRVVDVNKRNYNKSQYKGGIINYQLKIGTKSGAIYNSYGIFCSNKERLLRFYFDVNSNLMRRLDAEYSKEIPSSISPESAVEYDPWNYLSDSD